VNTGLSFPSEQLVDDLVLLRAWEEADVPAKIMGFGDPIVQQFSWPHTTVYSEADARSFFEEQAQARLRGEELNFALAEPAAHNVVLGGASLYGIDLSQKCASVGCAALWLRGGGRAAFPPPIQGRQARLRLVQPASRRAAIAALWRGSKEARSDGRRVMVSRGLAVRLAADHVFVATDKTGILQVEFAEEPSSIAGGATL
jgi:hypothetical protein